MSTSNPGEDFSPSKLIIQIAETITKELKQDGPSINRKEITKALKTIIELAQKQQFTTNIAGTIDRLESSLSGIAQSQKQQFTNINKRIDKFENTKS